MRRKKNTTDFNIENFAEKELVDTFSLWMLRVIFKLNTINEFIDKDGDIREENIASFLGLVTFVNQDNTDKKEIISVLKNKHYKLENRKRFGSLKTLKSNLNNITKLVELNDYEIKLLEFSILLEQFDILDDVTGFLGGNLNLNQTKRVLSVILNIPSKEIEKAFSPKSKFSKSSLLIMDAKYTGSLKNNLDFITDSFSSNMISSKQNMETIFKEIICQCEKTSLSLKDFGYLDNELNVMIPHLKESVNESKKGTNILLYGVPGTGKTELVKAISNELQTSLFEISYCDEDDEPIEGVKRLKAFKFAQSLLLNKKTFLMFDEVEDIFNNDNPFSKRQNNKAWINRTLENNMIPTIWITNDISSIDNAIIRRFDMSIEVPIPSKSKRKDILTKYSKSQVSENLISSLSINENIAPALVSTASKVVSNLKTKDKDNAFEMIISNTLKAQGHEYKKNTESLLPKSYNPTYVNCEVNLKKLAVGIKENPNARVCLYGAAGTGKSAYGKYLADYLDKPLLLKKGSDLISMWVGGTEKNIANAFKEAKDENAILIFDEVDSFLADRTTANKSWEVTQVNEMLVQMENFNGIFIATTNLMNNLDKASLRRFDLKLEFNFLNPKQAFELFKVECTNLEFTDIEKQEKNIKSLTALTPGDFAAVLRQNRFMPMKTADDFYYRLKEEVNVKNLE